MTSEEFVESYFAALSLSPGDAESRQRALDRAHELRKFEINLYWKRASYFWTVQAAAFAFVGFLRGASAVEAQAFIIPAALGFLTAVVGYLSARGSKFWQDSWEGHVDLLEPACEARLSQVFVLREKPRHSVTRVNQNLLLLIAGAWLVALLTACFPSILEWILGWSPPLRGGVAFVLTMASWAWLAFRSRSNLTGRALSLGGTDWQSYPNNRASLLLLRRDPAGSQALRSKAP
jgi:hypothetical protein